MEDKVSTKVKDKSLKIRLRYRFLNSKEEK